MKSDKKQFLYYTLFLDLTSSALAAEARSVNRGYYS